MIQINGWFGPLAEDFFSRYINGQLDTSEFKDDGSNLRFASRSPQYTIVLNWKENQGSNVATLTDSKTQIEAVLAKESLEGLKKEACERPLNRSVTLNHYAQLLDYEIVLEYAMPAPKIHLYVKKISIVWDKGKYKGAPQGKSVKKSVSIRRLMRKVFEIIKPRENRHATVPPDAYGLDDSPKSPAHDSSGKHASQQFLQSQVQASSVVSGVPPMMPPIQTKHSSTGSDALLGYLESHNKPADSGLPDNSEPGTVAIPGNEESPERTDVRGSSPNTAKSPSDIPRNGAQGSGRGSRSGLTCLTQQNTHVSPQKHPGAGHELPTMKADEGATSKVNGPQGQGHENPTSPQSSPKQKIRETKHASKNSSSSHTDPWHGMTNIRTRDIRIPKNQATLLEQHTRQWVPPDHGDSIKGHVPPEILAQWNKIALQRSRLSERGGLGSFGSERVEFRELSPGIDSPTAQIYAESDDEPVTSEWSESSPERVSRPRLLPADSSPVAGAMKKRNNVNITRPDNAQKEKQPGEVGSAPARETQQDSRAMSRVQEDNDLPMTNSPSENNANKEHIPTSVHNNTKAAEHNLEEKSDAESDDSIMDTSVPYPLGGSQQSNITNQSEIISSGASLPARGHVQVLETPLANPKHWCSTRLDKDKACPDSRHIEQSSSQVAKSSSQSRIVNTYATNDDDTEGTQTTNVSRVNGVGETGDTGILGTQISMSDWSMPDATPTSHTAHVPDSSAPKEYDSSAPIPMSTLESRDSLRPFSSQDEVFSSMGFEEKELEVVSGQRDTPKHSQKSPLKRPASNIEGEEPPSKRHRFTQYENIDAGIVNVTRPASGVVSRRQDYIRHSAEHLEAQRIHEKFRNDYPSYVGDFRHFRKVCAILQAIRDKGRLQRSFLWDDFITKHLDEYPRYLEQCLTLETKALGYDEYFTSHFSKPTHKKRSLTAEGIKVVAAQNIPPSLSDAAASPLRLRIGADTSFTASLVDKFSNFHAHSFGPATEGAQSDTDVDGMSFTVSSPTQQTKNNVRFPGDGHHKEAEAQQPEVEKQHSEAEEQASEIDEPLCLEMNTQLSRLRNLDGNESIVVESEINSDEDGLMDEIHETASIELGDEEPSTDLEAPLPDNESEAASEAESPNENWFLSLRHLFPTEPSWCDDPDTPFKKWARADQNAFSERKLRRNWARIPTDEKGIPQRPCYSNPPE